MEARFIAAAPAVDDGPVAQGNLRDPGLPLQMALHHFPEEERVRRAAAAGVEDDDVLSLPGPVGPGESQQFTDQAAGTDGVGFLIGKALDLSLGIKIIKGSRSLDERLAGKDTAGLIGKENQLPAYFFCKKLPLPVDEDGTAAAGQTMAVADQTGYEVDIGQADAGLGQGDGEEDGCPLFFGPRPDAPAQEGLFPFDDLIRPPFQGPDEDAADALRMAGFVPADLHN